MTRNADGATWADIRCSVCCGTGSEDIPVPEESRCAGREGNIFVDPY